MASMRRWFNRRRAQGAGQMIPAGGQVEGQVVPSPGDGSLELADAVELVRQHLQKAEQAGQDGWMQFEVGPIELEFAVELRNSTDLKAGAKFYVIDASAGKSIGETRIHRLKLTLNPYGSPDEPS